MISYKIVLFATTIGIIPLFFWFFLFRENSQAKNWESNLWLKILFIGVISAIPASILQIMHNEFRDYFSFLFYWENFSIKNNTFINILIPVFIEEASKGLGIIYLISKNLEKLKPNFGLIVGALVGIAFAITENGVYFSSFYNQETTTDFIQIIFLRFLLSTTAHIIYSALFGFFWELFLRKINIFYAFGSILVAILVHFLFNFSLENSSGFFVLIITIFGFATITGIFLKNKKNATDE